MAFIFYMAVITVLYVLYKTKRSCYRAKATKNMSDEIIIWQIENKILTLEFSIKHELKKGTLF